MKYLFGPVNSRRLGLSLGIDLLPSKICNLNCIYCEVGATTDLTCERKVYVPTEGVIGEIDELLSQKSSKDIDVYTITGTGEPTLHSDIGKIIRYLKKHTGKPVAVLTNGTLLYLKSVRDDLSAADIVIPSLDSARSSSYRKVNRPATCAALDDIIEGLRIFCKNFQGEVWLEILLSQGMNDTPEDINALEGAIKEIQPDRVQLNTVARPPLEKYAIPLSRERMEEIADRLKGVFDGSVDMLVDFEKRSRVNFQPVVISEIIQMLKRRPCTASDICEALNLDRGEIDKALMELEKDNKIRPVIHNGDKYYHFHEFKNN